MFSNWPKIDVNFLFSFIVLLFLAEHFVELESSSLPFSLSGFIIYFLYSFFAFLFDAFETGS